MLALFQASINFIENLRQDVANSQKATLALMIAKLIKNIASVIFRGMTSVLQLFEKAASIFINFVTFAGTGIANSARYFKNHAMSCFNWVRNSVFLTLRFIGILLTNAGRTIGNFLSVIASSIIKFVIQEARLIAGSFNTVINSVRRWYSSLWPS